MKKLFTNLLLFFFVVITVAFLSEHIFRIYKPFPYSLDPKYGWRLHEPNITYKQVEDDFNITRNITVQYYSYGFKRWGPVNTEKKKVFIVGDSFAEMPYVNNGEEWYSYLEEAYDWQLFVYGARGFGSLQEYFIIDDYIDMIKPDIIILQFHYNDFINNVHEFEQKQFPMSNLAQRPYWVNGEIEYRMPLKFESLRYTSWIFGYALKNYDRYKLKQVNKDEFIDNLYGNTSWKKDFTKAAIFDAEFNKSLNVTMDIFGMIQNRTKDIPVYLLSVDSRLKWAEKQLADSANFTYIEGLSDFVFKAHHAGINTQIVNDGHWNQLGNKLAGEYLVHYFWSSD